MRRVMYVIHGPAFGGAHMQVLRLREPLAELGWDCLAVLPTEPGDAARRLRAGGAEVVAIDLHRLRASADPRLHARLIRGFRPEVRALRSLIRERSVDVVQVHGPTNPHGAVAARLERAAVVWQLLDLTAPPPLRRLAMPAVLRLADAVTAYGHAVARDHPGALDLGERLVQVFPPVDTSEFDPGRRESARAALGVPTGACVVGTVGLRTPEKRHELLVRAAAALRGAHPQLSVRILGGVSRAHAAHDERVRAEARALGLDTPGAVDFVEPDGRVPELLPGLDVFALTSRSEGMPTVILEAMACGLPVVATDVGAVRELVEHGATGLVVPADDEARLTHSIGRLVADPGLRAEMGAEARRRACERYDLGRLAGAHVRAFELALAHRDGRQRRL